MTERAQILALPVPTPSLQQRVQRRREVLQQWLDKGIPHDQLDSLPTSLNAARKWDDPAMGIFPIGSPNNFTTSHPEVGGDVEAIADLIGKLHAKIKRPARKRKAPGSQPTISAKEVEQAVRALISQWHVAREEAQRQKERADRAEKHRDLAREELRAKEVEVAELRRRLSGGLSLVQ
jgi:hypothetical protein